MLSLRNAFISKRTKVEIQRLETLLIEESVSQRVEELNAKCFEAEQNIDAGKGHFSKLEALLQKAGSQVDYINVGLLPPTYRFDDRESLKESINNCRTEQLALIKENGATRAFTTYTWDESAAKGLKMVNDYRHLLLKAFNAEFDFIRKKMRLTTFTTAKDKLKRLVEQLEKLGETTGVSISSEYLNLKIQELKVWHGELKYKEKQKQEKKKQQELLRQSAKDDVDDVDDVEDELIYRKSDLEKARKKALELHGESAAEMELKIAKIKDEITALEMKFERATSQAQITKAGYIYVISNIGSFGEGVVKIGMTRRLEPMDRVNELGDASVPFKFDVHSLTFVKNAPELERQLHQAFDSKRVNTDNPRKEFFKISPQEVANEMAKTGIESDWYFDIEAKEYRESLLIRQAQKIESKAVDFASDQLPKSI